ncbi:hypothetical protein TREMEDRAFT_43048 [Tremella mesenterica DSM 1558]|uniref:uncharacterized protein n=1 Tax=Tremella mesenterica (strain ATCC 24925 / CBS 8224 / DSM 1558 / NBRC 9311 / NRRL Y-6157 / RJB 2259-6 / UBC 559-6) TaxID=578456 RepID=UPI0003F48FAD|nr:uncharacterized protein TREMEDRAFT_43048 [Tremella mesenterica DSM 1558]EIW71751.1 hypothetical protein TREMEDRAFT_43048 [Tremella mesenterica DSM 1558]
MSFFAKLGSSGSDTSDSGSDSEESIRSGSEGEEQDRKLAAAKKEKKKHGASMFLKSDAEDSDDSSDEEEEEMSEDEDEDDDDDDDDRGNLANQFLKGAASSEEESEEEDKTVVLSAKDKRFAEMETSISKIQNAIKNADGARNDWVLAASELDKLIRFITRHQTSMISSPIPPAGHFPPAFLACLVELNDAVNETITAEKTASKKMPVPKAKALSAIRQTLKKKMKEFEIVLTTYQEDPTAYASAYDVANVAPAVPKVSRKTTATAPTEEGDEGDFQTIGKGGKTLNLTPEGVFKTLKDIAEQRGKKNTDRAETIRILTKLLEVSVTTYQKIRVYLSLLPARLDYSQHLPSIPHDSWISCRQEYDDLISLLLKESDYMVAEVVPEYDDMVDREPEEVDGQKQRVIVAGSLIGTLEGLDNEFTKTLQHTDAQEKGAEYIERLKEEAPLYATICKAQVLFERENMSDQTARAVMRRLEHVHAKPDIIIDHFEQRAISAIGSYTSSLTPFTAKRSPAALIHTLCVYIYSIESTLLRTRAILFHIFNRGMHGEYHQARDLLLMSHIQDTVQQADVTTQILYNRAVMQLGLAAFRQGLVEECRTILQEIFSTQKQKELLAQAVQRYNNFLTPDQESKEKRRLLPFHLHLNLELLEAAYLTSCMLIEIPLLANAQTEEQRRRVASKTFKRHLDMAERQAFMGPPEHTRDHVVKAAKALEAGDWERAKELILSIKVWSLLDNVDEVKATLAIKVQEEALRTYLFTYSAHYASLSLSALATTFDLPLARVQTIVSRMIYNDELQASLDAIDSVIVFQRIETTEVQKLAQQLADRAVAMLETNEKTLDQKLGQGGQGVDRESRGATGGEGKGTERRQGQRGTYRGRGRGRGFQSGLGGAMGQRRVAA